MDLELLKLKKYQLNNLGFKHLQFKGHVIFKNYKANDRPISTSPKTASLSLPYFDAAFLPIVRWTLGKNYYR